MTEQFSTISVRINQEERDFLTRFSNHHKIKRGNGQPSFGPAIRQLIRQQMTEASQPKAHDLAAELHAMKGLLEQIHVAIPHLTYYSLFNYKVTANSITDQRIFDNYSTNTMETLASLIGQFQHQNHPGFYVAKNAKNMVTLPVDRETNQWK